MVLFHSTPTHSSWMNQIEIWLSYSGTQAAQTRFVPLSPGLTSQGVRIREYSNRTMAQPFKWTSQGKAFIG